MSAPVCAKCEKPLEVEVQDEDFSDEEGDVSMSGGGEPRQTVPDDVLLSCGDHFHWECLLEAYEIDTCPKCSRNITSSHQQAGSSSSSSAARIGSDAETKILVDLTNEGGLQQQIDIFPILKEESYLHAYPEERKSRAFLEFCREGDHRAIAELVKSCSEDADDDEDDEDDSGPGKTAGEILRYQDPIGDMQSGLHAAAANGHREVAWLLLLLASEYPELEFPALVFQEAASLQVMREDQTGKVDIRSLRDAHGRSAEDVARQAGIVWNGWIGNGRLTVS
ncbi:Putative Zinc finger, RING/FYVE/PHD-type [Septoria linicola]|uniref:Zinc finger, RING/FYVE/PHD-type n=1 Tax=Septoria linicola TaxID=215465 RepID=A0A9Q9EMY4_9PEZI|nr:Putative Zinc finger, RING/FYVE/PHD-type [Septoria linicola]